MFYDFRFEAKYLNLYEHLGINVELILREAGIPPRAIKNNSYKLTLDQYKSILGAFDKEILAEEIVEFSKMETTVMFVPEFYAGLCASDGLKCIDRISKYKKIIAPVKMIVETNMQETSISYVFNDGDKLPYTMLLNAYISIISILRQGAGVKCINPVKVYSEQGFTDNAIEYMGVTPVISDESKIVFNNRDLNRPFITENNNMWDYLETELNQRLKELEVDDSVSATLRKTLIELIPGGVSDQNQIAFELGMSKRTLQRKLKEEGTTYNEQLNQTRELLVRNYLKTGMNLEEIAFLVNYLDAKSLSRAFKSWTGMSVTEYKREFITE